MTHAATQLDRLARERPEWAPWLAVVAETVREAAGSRWDNAVPGEPNATGNPMLAGTTVALPIADSRKLFDRLVRTAASTGTPKLATLSRARFTEADVLAVFRASLCQDDQDVATIAAASGVDTEALQAIASLLPVPFLQACNRRWASAIAESWIAGYCPVCASRPAFVEVRGIERTRLFRCGRCGSEWHAPSLSCLYCGMNDHDELVTLVPESGASHAIVEACTRCRGYIKAFTRLQGCTPDAVMVDDLASVDLDVAALDKGYARPAGAAVPLEVTISATGARRLFAWG
jgi:FdhE protein